jgi:hypothetical protein
LTSGAVIEITSPAHKEVSAGRTALAAGGITTLALAVLVIVAAVAAVAAFGSSY